VSVVDLSTGEVLERLDEQPPETLAQALDVVRAQIAERREWETALAGELRNRLKMRGSKLVVFGDWEVEATVKRESDWDVDGLEAAMRDLVDEGIVRAGDVAEVITRTPVVSRSKAKTLLSRLTGDARERVAALCTWREKPGAVTVARSVALPAPDSLSAGEDGRTLSSGEPAPIPQPAPAPASPVTPIETEADFPW